MSSAMPVVMVAPQERGLFPMIRWFELDDGDGGDDDNYDVGGDDDNDDTAGAQISRESSFRWSATFPLSTAGLLCCATPSLRSKWDVSIGPKIVGNSVSGLSQSCQSKLKSLFAGWRPDMTRGTATSTLDLSKGRTCKCSPTRKYQQYALRFCLKIFFYIALENSVTEISDYKTIQVLRLLNGCKEEVRNRKFQKLGKTSNI